ncbi:MAG: hypothetical protein GC149_12220 [Gammaproteobacteria bacterium]|nr:hypothetical protein [Gammaproteobacteria bacterium]
MAFPLATVLNAAPGLISAAADIIGMIRKNKQAVPQADTAKLDELAALLEQQAKVLEELALNNRNLVLAVRNNRIVAVAAVALALCATGIAIWAH